MEWGISEPAGWVESSRPRFLSVRGSYVTVGSPIKFSELQPATITGSPLLGEHTEAILAELGYDEARIAALRDAGAI
jgi:formyl-CoA transferase